MKPIKTEYVIIGIVALLVGLWYFGVFDDVGDLGFSFTGDNGIVPEDSENIGLGKADLYYMLTIATGKALNRDTTYEYIDKLDMKVYGSNSHYTTIAASFRTEYGSWVNLMDMPITNGQAMAWQQGNNAVSVITASSPTFRALYNYETLTLTAHGDINDYNDFYWFVITS